MPITVIEKVESRTVSRGVNPSAEFRYVISGTDDEIQAQNALEWTAPLLYDPWGLGLLFLRRESVTVTPLGDDLWEGIVRYGTIPQTAENVFSFDTGGGTQHITHSLQTVGAYAPQGQTPPDFQGAIGVTPDGVEGVDITVPVYNFSETHYLHDVVVTQSYRLTVFSLTGKVNSGPFRGFAPGEVLFLGASGTRRGGGDWEITFRFAASRNRTNLTVGDITGISKKGWEYLWVRYADEVDDSAKALVKRPVAVYIEKVYEEGDFGLLGI